MFGAIEKKLIKQNDKFFFFAEIIILRKQKLVFDEKVDDYYFCDKLNIVLMCKRNLPFSFISFFLCHEHTSFFLLREELTTIDPLIPHKKTQNIKPVNDQ